jgi:predicted O-methyltransferase YrrM
MNTITGWYTYKDTTTLQHKDIGNYLKKLFETTKPSQILEIGTSFGGLTLLIRDLLDDSNLSESDLRSYDVMETNRFHLQEAIKNKSKIDFRIKNVFNHGYDNLIEIDEIKDYIQKSGPTIIMCDGGSKKNEFNILAKYLKKGDIIMAHDYSPNAEYFEENINNKIWNWHEIKDTDIEDTVNECNLKPFMQEDFQKVVWVCKIKE